ncbi:MAG: hypothetical protein LUO93_02945 [Methanomicrobiales archaeon]|nr:hypothetical protein [Methanomicrobiales archaeon]
MVSVQDAIVVQDPSDGGITNVRIQPLFLSGSYRFLTAEVIANYLVGQAVQRYDKFELVSVRETTDRSMIELVGSFTERNVRKTGVYTVFVRSPYAVLTSYETAENYFSQREDLLRAIASSFTPVTPPDMTSSTVSSVKGSTLGLLRDTQQSGKVHIRIPESWSVQVFPGCVGLLAFEADNSRGIIFLNRIHSDLQTGLPPGVTPETYLTTYMPQDFTTISNIRFLQYEDIDVSFLSGGNPSAVRAMRCSFENNGVPSIGSFTIGTRQIGGYYTTVDYLWGIYSTSDQFMADAPTLIEIITSIDYSEATLEQCRAVLSASWGGSSRGGGSTAEDLREQRLNDWYAKQEKEDIFLEKYSDYILDRDRVFNPETNEVYHVDQNFYQYYDTHREEFKQQNMITLTEDQYRTYVPLDGTLHVEPD